MSEVARISVPDREVPEPLWREILGSRLRALRAEREQTLAQLADRAGISPQYLSEIERGRKEPSSEMIAALAGALGIPVAELMAAAAEDLRQFAATAIVVSLGASDPLRVGGAGMAVRHAGMRPSGMQQTGPVALAIAA